MAPRPRKRASRPKPRSRGGGGGDEDPFFEPEPKRRRGVRDENIESGDSDDEIGAVGGVDEDREDEEGNEEEETVGEKKMRIAKELLKRVTEASKRREDDDEEEDDAGGRRLADILQRRQLEESGRKRRELAARVLPPEPKDGFKLLVKHRQPVTAVALSRIAIRDFQHQKMASLSIGTLKLEKVRSIYGQLRVLVSHHAKPPLSAKRSKQVLALAVSSDGRYLASGGLDRHIHLWDVRSREHIQVVNDTELYFTILRSS